METRAGGAHLKTLVLLYRFSPSHDISFHLARFGGAMRRALRLCEGTQFNTLRSHKEKLLTFIEDLTL